MANIDSVEAILKIDKDGFLNNTQEFPDQCERCWADWKNIPLPARFVQAKNILITGMGGSSIGGALVAGLAKNANIPVVIWRDYGIPGWVNKDTLVVAISFSGNTEETLNSFKLATTKTDKLVTIARGGDLEVLSRKYKTTHYTINYQGQPRASFGFLFTSVLAVFAKLKLIELSDEDFAETVVLLRGLQKRIDIQVPTANNPAKLLAKKLDDKIPVVYGSGILEEMTRRWCNEFGENSKVAAFTQVIPEMNHNTFNGVEFPKNLGQRVFVIMLESRYDHPRNKIRHSVVMQVLDKHRIPYESLDMDPAPTPLAELLQYVLFGAYVTLYLGIMYDSDPTQIDVVHFLKDKLAEKPFES